MGYAYKWLNCSHQRPQRWQAYQTLVLHLTFFVPERYPPKCNSQRPTKDINSKSGKGKSDHKMAPETTFICASQVLQVGPNVNKNIFWRWKLLWNQCFVIKIGTRINCALFVFFVCFDSEAIVIQIQFQNHYFCWKNTKYEKRDHSLSFWYSAGFIQQSEELTFGNVLVYLST